MGKSELLMVIAAIALSIMIALITIPAFTKGSDLAKISLINSDISSIRKVSQTYVESKSSTGDFKDIDASKIHSLIPALELTDCSGTPCFTSSANKDIKYIIDTEKDSNNKNYNSVLKLKIEGLLNIDGSKESILKNQEKLNINTNTTPEEDANLDVVELHFKG